MVHDVSFFCKSFRPDFDYLDNLLQSFAEHNPDGLKFTLSLPAADLAAFANRFGAYVPNVKLVADESYAGVDLTRFRGWHGQQICKLASWRAVEATSYVVLDSDCYFIRDVTASEFLPVDRKHVVFGSKIRTVLREADPNSLAYINGSKAPDCTVFPRLPTGKPDRLQEFLHYKDLNPDNPGAIERSDIPFKVFGSDAWIYYQPGQIFSRHILLEFEAWLDAAGLKPSDAILISPWEYNWYGEFAAAKLHSEVEFRVSPLLHFQTEADIDFAKGKRLNIEIFAKRFAIIQMAARHINSLRY